MTNADCLSKHYKGFPVTDRMLCAWKKNSTGATIGDTCGGDSGGTGAATIRKTTYSITTLSITIHRLKGLIAALSIDGIQRNVVLI